MMIDIMQCINSERNRSWIVLEGPGPDISHASLPDLGISLTVLDLLQTQLSNLQSDLTRILQALNVAPAIDRADGTQETNPRLQGSQERNRRRRRKRAPKRLTRAHQGSQDGWPDCRTGEACWGVAVIKLWWSEAWATTGAAYSAAIAWQRNPADQDADQWSGKRDSQIFLQKVMDDRTWSLANELGHGARPRYDGALRRDQDQQQDGLVGHDRMGCRVT